MSNEIADLLADLAAVAPDVCLRGRFGRWEIGEYSFGLNPDGSIYAVLQKGNVGNVINGRPALAWLRDAIGGAIKSQAWLFEIEQLTDWSFNASVYRWTDDFFKNWSMDEAHALLAAFVAALTEESNESE